MPNWVRNRVKIIGEKPQEIINKFVTYDEDEDRTIFDFDKIIKMPEELHIQAGTLTDNCMRLFMNAIKKTDEFKKYITIIVANEMEFIPLTDSEHEKMMKDCLDHNCDFDEIRFKNEQEVLDYGRRAYDNILEFGARDWYEWRIENWGCKWNSSRCEFSDDTVFFETPWDPCPKVIQQLSKMYPNHKFEYDFCDEQICIYAGEFEIENGEFIKARHLKECSKEAYEKGFELWPGTQKYFKFNKKTGNYEYIEDNME